MHKKKILVIDDEISIRFIVEHTFKEEFDVICLADGQEALDYLEAGNFPDMIICDLMMPKLNGFEFLGKIQASGFFDDIPVMILSGRDMSDDKIKCFEMGAEDYLVKPFNPNELIARIKRRIEVKERYLHYWSNME
ncbi:MAG: response regulator transcription factor [Bacteroidales bacterium]|nr:response regulator transcription factor [Bacteroidales bacterium]